MPKFKVAWDYTSNIGSFDAGAVVDVDDELAEHVNRDSPGVLKPVKGKAKADTKPNAGSVDDILDRVGSDPEAAAEVLEAEQAEKDPRVTLVEALESVIGGED